MEKLAETQVAVHELIARRWSPRAFDASRPVIREQLLALLEAARWAPSCFGDEPWRYVVCDKAADPQAWQLALGCLAEKNQLWAKNAPVLIIAVAASHFSRNDKPNRWGQYDTGAASENLCLQAVALGLAAHQMGGFDAARASEAFAIPADYTCMSVIAVGHQAPADAAPEEFRAAELGARSRQPLGSHFYSGRWSVPYPD